MEISLECKRHFLSCFPIRVTLRKGVRYYQEPIFSEAFSIIITTLVYQRLKHFCKIQK